MGAQRRRGGWLGRGGGGGGGIYTKNGKGVLRVFTKFFLNKPQKKAPGPQQKSEARETEQVDDKMDVFASFPVEGGSGDPVITPRRRRAALFAEHLQQTDVTMEPFRGPWGGRDSNRHNTVTGARKQPMPQHDYLLEHLTADTRQIQKPIRLEE